MNERACSASGCTNAATVEVHLYDVYGDGNVFSEQDSTCPYLCAGHVAENEQTATGERRRRGQVVYRHTKKHRAQGFTIYRPLTVQ
jgi:hypothetical protein